MAAAVRRYPDVNDGPLIFAISRGIGVIEKGGREPHHN
jgi:hypothetical protein